MSSEGSKEWRPNPGPQTQFLASTAYEVLFGGAAGGSKTESLVVAPLRWAHEPDFRAIILRRTFPELEKSIIDRARGLYPVTVPGAKYNEQKKYWLFPSGARIYFGHLEHDSDVHQYQGAELQFLAFDELTHFTERQFTYLLSRARSSKGLPIRIRAATNPGGEGHEWVLRRWAPWLDTSHPNPAAPGEVRWYLNTTDGEKWVPKGTAHALSRTFIPSRIVDNPHLVKNDPGYFQRLMGLDAVTRAQLLEGDWLAKPAAGVYFKRAWLPIVDEVPVQAQRIRYWDRASSPTGDWTVGVLLAHSRDGLWWIEDVVRMRGTPREVEATIIETAEIDGKQIAIGIEKDPGQAGQFEADYYVRALAGWNVRVFAVTKDKVTRAQPASAQCEGGNFRMKRGLWNAKFVAELEAFPEGDYDDQVDALSGAFAALTFSRLPPYQAPPHFASRWARSTNGVWVRGN